jgi:hypothetical protein
MHLLHLLHLLLVLVAVEHLVTVITEIVSLDLEDPQAVVEAQVVVEALGMVPEVVDIPLL